MPAALENKYAEKITLKDAIELANKAYNTVSEDCYFISSVADECGIYRQKFDYILKKFNDSDEVFDTLKRMHNKCERIVMEKTAAGKINTALGIFVLKAYHGLFESSKNYTDITTGGDQVNVIKIQWPDGD